MNRTKRCPTCSTVKAHAEFGPDRTHKDGLSSACRACRRQKANAWYRKNPVKAKNRNLARYGITLEDYGSLLAKQHGCCAICHRPPTDGKLLVVDHDHATGMVRGLLHNECNVALGLFQDNPTILIAAANYLVAAAARQ